MELFPTKLIIYTYGKEQVLSLFYFLLLCSFSLKYVSTTIVAKFYHVKYFIGSDQHSDS